RDAPACCQRGQERRDFRATHVTRMALAVGHDEAAYPANVRALRAQAVMPDPACAADLIEQPRRRQRRKTAARRRSLPGYRSRSSVILHTAPGVRDNAATVRSFGTVRDRPDA